MLTLPVPFHSPFLDTSLQIFVQMNYLKSLLSLCLDIAGEQFCSEDYRQPPSPWWLEFVDNDDGEGIFMID